jgi:hypothetical protein
MRIKYFLFGAAALALGACSSEESENVAPSKGEAYVQFSVKLPSADATRSATTGDGTDKETTAEGVEVGKTEENLIKTVQVILFDGTDYAQSVRLETAGDVPVGDTYNTEPIKVNNLLPSKTYTAYVIVNGAVYGGSDVAAEAITGITSVAGLTATNGIAESGKFLMTGKGVTDAITTGADVTVYTKDYPLDCGEIKVERAAARFDYAEAVTGNKYDLTSTADELTVTLTDIALTNVSPSFYLFKRVSADGTDTSWDLTGYEIGGTTPNYVVDYNFANKTAANWSTFDASNDYINKYTGATADSYTALSTLSTADNSWSGTGDTRDYKIWTYCTENTIQYDPTVNQINGLSTGVIFKGEIAGTTKAYGSTTELAFNGTDNAYVLNGKVYGPWSAVEKAFDANDADVKNAFAAATAGGFSLDKTDETATGNTKAALQAAGFTRYKAVGAAGSAKYYAYYVYWNRHNDNGVSNVMGPMEFAVVRNNVYKLAVTEIKQLGHPNDPNNPGPDPDPDPDDPDPEDPNEDSSIYLKVSVKVLPWTVRKNDIKF